VAFGEVFPRVGLGTGGGRIHRQGVLDTNRRVGGVRSEVEDALHRVALKPVELGVFGALVLQLAHQAEKSGARVHTLAIADKDFLLIFADQVGRIRVRG